MPERSRIRNCLQGLSGHIPLFFFSLLFFQVALGCTWSLYSRLFPPATAYLVPISGAQGFWGGLSGR
ncbi:hypothetical protein F4806DRAFT_454629 [Annulohypoxylon nitens]|nr:hypothetical protein F4806DRAFT_454629 [Annulohypoxylon nitens]